jgi:hypothetical protein
MNLDSSSRNKRLLERARLFVKLGTTAFGGPAAHIAMMEVHDSSHMALSLTAVFISRTP